MLSATLLWLGGQRTAAVSSTAVPPHIMFVMADDLGKRRVAVVAVIPPSSHWPLPPSPSHPPTPTQDPMMLAGTTPQCIPQSWMHWRPKGLSSKPCTLLSLFLWKPFCVSRYDGGASEHLHRIFRVAVSSIQPPLLISDCAPFVHRWLHRYTWDWCAPSRGSFLSGGSMRFFADQQVLLEGHAYSYRSTSNHNHTSRVVTSFIWLLTFSSNIHHTPL